MRVLITAGGTREDIDPVRGITNYATGRLGCLIADEFIKAGAQATYICSETAAKPENAENCRITTIRNTMQLMNAMESELKSTQFNAVIHSMAVSDYAPQNTSDKKISSSSPYIVVVLKKLPKVINIVKKLQPEALLIGFKLTSGADETELISAAKKLIIDSGADYVLANRAEDIYGDTHKAVLLGKNETTIRGSTKRKIAEIIRKVVCGG